MKRSFPQLYHFNVSGQHFYLSYRNIMSDGPNRLTKLVCANPNRSYFTLDTNPDVFTYIQRHLQGYHALDVNHIILLDLQKDAAWYGLSRLLQWCNARLETTAANATLANESMCADSPCPEMSVIFTQDDETDTFDDTY